MKIGVTLFVGIVIGITIMQFIAINSGRFYTTLLATKYDALEVARANVAWDSSNYLEAYRHYSNILDANQEGISLFSTDFWDYKFPYYYFVLSKMDSEQTDSMLKAKADYYEDRVNIAKGNIQTICKTVNHNKQGSK